MAIAGGSGGQSVAIADAFAEAGLELPLLTQESYDELATFWTFVGGGYPNPIDTGNVNRREMRRILEILERDTNIDNLVVVIGLITGFRTPEELENDIRLVVNIRKRTLKPVMVITPSSILEGMRRVREVAQKLQDGGVPVMATFERGARALRNALEYYRFKNGINT